MPIFAPRWLCSVCRREHPTEELALSCEASTPERPGMEVGKRYRYRPAGWEPPFWTLDELHVEFSDFHGEHRWAGMFSRPSVGGVRRTTSPIGDPADWTPVAGPGEGKGGIV